MRDIFLLLKKDFLIFYNKEFKSDKNSALKLLVYVFLFIMILVFSVVLRKAFTPIFESEYGLSGLMSILAIGVFVALFVSIPQVLSRLYFSEDVDILLRLPIRVSAIISSVILYSSFNSFLVNIVLFPSIFKYIALNGNSTFLKILSIPSLFLMCLLSVCFVVLIFVFLMRFINKLPRFKNILQILGLFLVGGINIFIQMTTRMGIENGFDEINSAIGKYTFLFPQIFPFIKILTADGSVSSFIWFLGFFSGVSILIFSVSKILEGSLVRGVQYGKVTTSNKNKKLRELKLESVEKFIFKKEIQDILKTPIYIYGIVFSGFMITAIIFISFAINSDGISNYIYYCKMEVSKILNSDNRIIYSTLAGFTILIFLSVNIAGGSTVSREGKNFWIIKTLPISAKENVNGRLKASILFQVISALPITVFCFYILDFNFLSILFLALGILSAAYLSSNFSMYQDISAPKLEWDNPQEIMKNNLSPLFIYFMQILYMVASIFILVMLQKFLKKYSFILAILFLGLNFYMGKVLYKKNIDGFENL